MIFIFLIPYNEKICNILLSNMYDFLISSDFGNNLLIMFEEMS